MANLPEKLKSFGDNESAFPYTIYIKPQRSLYPQDQFIKVGKLEQKNVK